MIPMALRLRRFKEIFGFVHKLNSGIEACQPSRGGISLSYLHVETSRVMYTRIKSTIECGSLHVGVFFRYSTVPKKLHEKSPEVDFMSFFKSTLDEREGPSHRWLNRVEGSKSRFEKDGIFLILICQFTRDSLVSYSDRNSVGMFEKVKSLQRRYPSLQVVGFQYSESIPTDAVCSHLFWRIIADYITFPVLLSNKYYFKMTDGVFYIMLKGFQSPLTYLEKEVDIGSLDKAVKDLIKEQPRSPTLAHKLESTWTNPFHIVKEPNLGSFLRNLFLYFPGCISVDEGGNRLFLSDVNHHRIIVFDNNGKILDAIGSSPGFEDAEFENTRLMRPAASFYHAVEDCLYFVDSENHAIRRADLERRVVETIYPTNTVRKNSSLWSWILDKLWKKRDADAKSEELHSDSFLFPWHLMKSSDNDFFVLNRSFETLWIMEFTSGMIREVVKGFPKILEICGQMIMEKSCLLKQMPNDWMQQQMHTTCSLDGIPCAGLMSSVANFKDHLIICDALGQMVVKLDANSGSISSFQFSNFNGLGFPYWFSFPLERVCAGDEVLSEMHIDHIEHFSLLPGRVKIMLNIKTPEDMDLVEPLKGNSVWRQARGAAVEVSGAESRDTPTEKVGVAQQWYDEIDSLTSATSEMGSSRKAESESSDEEVEEGGIQIDCTVSTSPGTSEVIICAPLYLRMKRSSISSSDGLAKGAARLADFLDPTGIHRRDYFLHFLLTAKRDLGELVFVKPLHVRVKFECGNHPKADNSISVVLTDSFVEVNVLL